MICRIFVAALFCLTIVVSSAAQKLPVLNGSAIFLPKPVYSTEFEELCAFGKVSIKVVIGLNGSVEKASPISGDPVLYDSAVAAVKRAIFRSNADGPLIEQTGVVIYDFPVKRKCIDVGIVNKRAKSIPKPDLSKIEHLSATPVVIEVRLIVDISTGKVKSARAFSGNIIYWSICQKSALKVRFTPTMIDGVPVDAKGTLVYKFNPDGSIEF